MNQVKNINILGTFCGLRDIDDLTSDCLFQKYGFRQADIMVLFGGSIISGGDLFAKSIQNHIANKFIIVGGTGHTTERLRQEVKKAIPDLKTSNLSEAKLFNSYIKKRYNVQADYLECNSTNCGNNVTNLLDLIKENHISCHNIIVCQDATMQRRMDAGFRKYSDLEIINYASYSATVTLKHQKLVYTSKIPGIWSTTEYISLLMGEIPRFTDYGPNGKNYIAHVDIPESVQRAFEELKKDFGDQIRPANPEFATKK